MSTQPWSSLYDEFRDVDEPIVDWVIDRKKREGRGEDDARRTLEKLVGPVKPGDHLVLEVLATTFPLIEASVVASVLEQCEYDGLDAARCLLGLVEDGGLDYEEDAETQAARAFQSRPVTSRTRRRQLHDDNALARALQESEHLARALQESDPQSLRRHAGGKQARMGRGKRRSRGQDGDAGSDDGSPLVSGDDDGYGEEASDSGSARMIPVKATFGRQPATAGTNDSVSDRTRDHDDEDDDDDESGDESVGGMGSRSESHCDLIQVKATFGKKPAQRPASVDSLDAGGSVSSRRGKKKRQPKQSKKTYHRDDDDEESDEGEEMAKKSRKSRHANDDDDDDEDDEDDEEDEEDSDEDRKEEFVGDYDPNDYEDLDVSSDVKEIFQYVTAYKPLTLELNTKVELFIPEFIPAVGDIDPFIQVGPPNPEKIPELSALGLKFVNEPAGHQSDPVILDLQFRDSSKSRGVKQLVVHSIPNAADNRSAITKWMNNVEMLHSDRPHAEVIYDKLMPERESLMQAWPANVEEVLNQLHLPSAEIDVDLKNYARLVCAVLDVPVHRKSLIQSLHVLFSLYSDFTNSQHFANKKRSEILTRLQDRHNRTVHNKSPVIASQNISESIRE